MTDVDCEHLWEMVDQVVDQGRSTAWYACPCGQTAVLTEDVND